MTKKVTTQLQVFLKLRERICSNETASPRKTAWWYGTNGIKWFKQKFGVTDTELLEGFDGLSTVDKLKLRKPLKPLLEAREERRQMNILINTPGISILSLPVKLTERDTSEDHLK